MVHTKIEDNANKYSWVWRKGTEKSRYRLYSKNTKLIGEMNADLRLTGFHIEMNTEQSVEISERYEVPV